MSSDWNIVSLLESASHRSPDVVLTTTLTSLLRPDARTENGAAAFSTTTSCILDLFGKLTRDLPDSELHRLFDLCWLENPTRLVQLIHYTRDCQSALGEKRLFYSMALRLRQLHPLTYLRNLQSFIGAGYFKDLLVLLDALEEANAPKLAGDDYVELLIFKEQLLLDLRALKASSTAPQVGAEIRISLAGKWAPSEGRHFDKAAKRLAKLLFRKDPEIHKKYRSLLTRLRTHLAVVERQMCANQWTEIPYQTVPARAMKIYRNAFKKHDQPGFTAYLEAVKSGEKKINSTGLQPHELTKPYMYAHAEIDETIEAQWSSLIGKFKGKFKNTLAVVDVSGSMSGVPMDVAIALGLVCCELTEGPFKNVVCTFSEEPELVQLREGTLKERVQTVQQLQWGGSTNFEGVMDLILHKYQTEYLRKEELPEMVIVFTDMQFNEASRGCREVGTMYDVVKKKFEDLELHTPRFIFWNLRASSSAFPVTRDTTNTALISGYSADLLKLFLQGQGDFNPIVLVKNALQGRPDLVDPSEVMPFRF